MPKIDAHKITGRDNESSEKWKVSFTGKNKRSLQVEFGGSSGSNKYTASQKNVPEGLEIKLTKDRLHSPVFETFQFSNDSFSRPVIYTAFYTKVNFRRLLMIIHYQHLIWRIF